VDPAELAALAGVEPARRHVGVLGLDLEPAAAPLPCRLDRRREERVPDLDTLGGLSSYRDPAATTAPLALGVWGEVVSGGRVRLGDLVQVRSASTDPGLPAQAARMR
jgi:hypothetical protein